MSTTTPPTFAPTDGSDRPPEPPVGAPLSLTDALLVPLIGTRRAQRVAKLVAGAETARLDSVDGSVRVGRADLAQALCLMLFEDLLHRVPVAAAYARDAERAGQKLVFDHGAVRTVALTVGRVGQLPGGAAAFARFLEPLGFRRTAVYPLPGLAMTGYSYAHTDRPEGLPQFFVSELHPERFSPVFEKTVERVVASSVDPLPYRAKQALLELQRHRAVDVDTALRLLPELFACFARQHDEPSVDDYEVLRRESAEMAWIATEGHQFNHITDRVGCLEEVVDEQRRLGRPIKDRIEVSRSGRVLQTAFRAVTVERLLFDPASGRSVIRSVPGSFHELIQRERLPSGELDLAFDAANAQGIFTMTAGSGARSGMPLERPGD